MPSVIIGTLFVVYFCSLVPGSADDDIPKWIEAILSSPRVRSHHRSHNNNAISQRQEQLKDFLLHEDELNLLLKRFKSSQRRSWIYDDPINRGTETTPATQPSTPPPPTVAPTTQTTAATTKSSVSNNSPSLPKRPSWWPSRWSWPWGKRRRRSAVNVEDLEDDVDDEE